MSESIYRQSLKNALRLTWRNKILWILGLLSIFLGEFGLNNFAGQIFRQINWHDVRNTIYSLHPIDAKTAIALIWLLIILIGLAILIIFAASIAEGALIFAAANWYKKNEIPRISQIWARGVASLWKVLAINIFNKGLLALVIFGTLPLWQKLLPMGGASGWLTSILLMAAEISIAFFISAVSIFALCYSVVGKENVWRSIKRGYCLFTEHLLVSLELSILLFVCNIILMLIILAASAFIFFPSLLIWIVAAVSGQAWLALIGLFVGWIILILFIACIGAVYNTFSTGAWVYLFMKMHHEGIASRIIHYAKKIFFK